MNRIAIDFVGPLTRTKKNNSYLLTVICPFSRWPQAFPVSRNTALKTIACLKRSISTYGTPSQVLSDRGFISSELAGFLNSMGIKHIATAPYTASTNGTVEGFHRFLAQQLSMRVNDKHSNWDEPEVLDAALLAYRTAPIDGMTVTPYEVMFGREPNMPIDNVLADEADQENEHQGRRLGHDKSVTSIAGQPVLSYGLRALLACGEVEKVVVTVRADVLEEAKGWVEKECGSEGARVEVIVGGVERQDSVGEGLKALGAGVEWVVVHDAARVLLTQRLTERVLEEARKSGAAAAARKMSDTVREADGEGRIVKLIPREGLWRMETPQVVRVEVLRAGLERAKKEKRVVTDCLAVAELGGVKGVLVEAEEPNLKITVPSDWVLAESWLKTREK